ncbi:globin [Vibrio campbellii]|uniref:globin n=1 Tax=Vibrio campbellii TaxID=680 RepID=UPI00215C7D8C|nr:globin [Vibrio campbellii]MCR9910693.1 globin [Vibrio campbellii]
MNVIEAFNDSYERCVTHEDFFDLFYENFWSKGENFRQKFDGVDMKKQIRMLKGSIVFVMMADTSTDARDMMRKYGHKHGHNNIGVAPEDIDVWFESLLETVAQCDSDFDESVEYAWRHCFETGLTIMKKECANV